MSIYARALDYRCCRDEKLISSFQWEPVEYFNNKIICDLVEAKPVGIIAIMVKNPDILI